MASKVGPEVVTSQPIYPSAPNPGYPGPGPAYPNPAYPNPAYSTPNPSYPAPTNTVVITQPAPGVQNQQREFSTTMCACCDDMGICMYACMCPTCFMCKLATDMDETCMLPFCVPAPLISMRAAWRNRHNIRGSIQNDCCAATFCGMCTMCQLARDIKEVKLRRGF